MHLKHQWQASKEITGQLGTIENNKILIKEEKKLWKICCQKSRQKTYFTVCIKLKARAFRLVNNYILNLEKNIFCLLYQASASCNPSRCSCNCNHLHHSNVYHKLVSEVLCCILMHCILHSCTLVYCILQKNINVFSIYVSILIHCFHNSLLLFCVLYTR